MLDRPARFSICVLNCMFTPKKGTCSISDLRFKPYMVYVCGVILPEIWRSKRRFDGIKSGIQYWRPIFD